MGSLGWICIWALVGCVVIQTLRLRLHNKQIAALQDDIIQILERQLEEIEIFEKHIAAEPSGGLKHWTEKLLNGDSRN
jgi:hypothetical protein